METELDAIDVEVGGAIEVEGVGRVEFEPLPQHDDIDTVAALAAPGRQQEESSEVDSSVHLTVPVRIERNEVAEWTAIDGSAFGALGGFTLHAFSSHILPYLEASELVSIGLSCKFFYRLHSRPHLWRELYKHDFLLDGATADESSVANSSSPREYSIQDDFLAYLQNIPHDVDGLSMLAMLRNELANHPASFSRQSSASTVSRQHHRTLHAAATNNNNNNNNNSSSNAHRRPSKTDANDLTEDDDGGVAKRRYQSRRHEYVQRLQSSAHDEQELEAEMRRMEQQRWLEQVLDWTQLRLQPIVWMGGWFLTIVLFTEKLDGLPIPYWACAIPLAFALLYCTACLYLAKYIHQRRFTSRSVFYGLFSNLTGPTTYVFAKVLHHSWVGVLGLTALMVVLLAQIAMVVVKLSTSVSSSTRRSFAWVLVFLPLWIVFAVGCVSPLCFRTMDIGAYIAAIVFVWIPAFIVAVGITVKLDGVQDVRLAHLFIPLFVYEGALVVGSLAFLLFGVFQYVRRPPRCPCCVCL